MVGDNGEHVMASDTLAVGVAQADLEDGVGAARPLKGDGTNTASGGVKGGDD